VLRLAITSSVVMKLLPLTVNVILNGMMIPHEGARRGSRMEGLG